MRGRDSDPVRFRLPGRSDLPTLLVYLGAGALYIVIGVLQTDFLLSWYVGAAYLIVVVWLVTPLVRRFL